MRLIRRAGRRTNLAIFATLIVAFGTGVLAYGVGAPWAARFITIAHGAAGLALLLLVPWKSIIVRRSTARGWGWVPGTALGVLVLVSITAGLIHVLTGNDVYLGVTALQVHVGAALIAVPLLTLHVLSHPQRARRTDLSRRVVLRAGALGGAAVASWFLLAGATRLLDLPGARRRSTGSFEEGSGTQEAMPVTQWFTDPVPRIDADSWRLSVGTRGRSRLMSYDELAAGTDQERAILDCTGGWYAEQEWRGMRLSSIIGEPPSTAKSIEVVSSTGYRRRFPIAEAPGLLLATHVAGEPLAAGHGAPARLVAPGRRGFWWVKWVTSVTVLDEPDWLQPPFPGQ